MLPEDRGLVLSTLCGRRLARYCREFSASSSPKPMCVISIAVVEILSRRRVTRLSACALASAGVELSYIPSAAAAWRYNHMDLERRGDPA